MFEHLEIAVAYSLLGACANLSNLYLSGIQLGFKAILANLVISGFSAALMYLIALRLGWQVYGIADGCGLAAWMGVKILAYFESRFLQKIEEKK